MDQTDRDILGALQHDGRITATELAKRIGLSLSATSDRLRQLTRTGVVRRFTAVIDPAQIGRPIEALIDVRLAPGVPQDKIDTDYLAMPSVTDAMHLTGRFDVQLRVAARDVAELDALLIEIKEQHGAEETNTRLILRTLDGFPRAPEPV